jgi:hypothetical protein
VPSISGGYKTYTRLNKNRMKKLTTIGLLILLISCSNKIDDRSLTVVEYMELGAPELNKVWKTSDYEKISIILNDIKKKNFYSLPMLESKNSGPLFSKLVSIENIDTLFTDQKERNVDITEFAYSYQKILTLYLENDENDFYHKELCELLIFTIKISDKVSSNLDKLTNLDLTSYLVIESKIKIANGYKNTIIGALKMQQIIKGFTENDLQKYSMAIVESLEKNKNGLDEGILQEIKQEIEFLLNVTESKILQSTYSNWLNSD